MPRRCRRDLDHDFDPTSGWCLGGCGWRDDGRSQYRAVGHVVGYPDITEPRHQRDVIEPPKVQRPGRLP